MIICFIIFLMMSYENRQHNLLIIIDMTGKFHTNILGKITINKNPQKINLLSNRYKKMAHILQFCVN